MSFFRSRWVDPPVGAEEIDPTELAPGFEAAGVACGIKQAGNRDLGMVACRAESVASAALFTDNAAAAAPVRLSRDRCNLRSLRAIVANSGNANAATGGRGRDDAAWMQGAAAAACGVAPAAVAVASTGVIGVPLPMEAVKAGVLAAGAELRPDGGSDFAEAIITTDNGPKHCRIACDGVTVSAQAKGAGMMQPRFATLLAFVQTDAVVDEPEAVLRGAADSSFARVTVDGQTSTNDSIFLQATGESGQPLPAGLLDAIMLQLALDLTADGEGASRVARVSVSEAAGAEEADRVARAIANSQLVQTAIFGRDSNWGRIVQAAGMALAGEDVDLDGSNIESEELGGPGDEVELGLRLGRGDASAEVYCSDLTYDYVKLNAEYTT
jgi:glutamate N-acetyltransferase / amino-acid N-acetyltransferase